MRLHQLTQPCKPPHAVGPAGAEKLWHRFLKAHATAMETLEISDGIRAGHAWAEFLGAFVTSPPIVPEQSE